MRVIVAGVLATGLILIGLSAYVGVEQGTSRPSVTTCEDGTPMPPPNPPAKK
jgi:hypothetical protein